MTLWFWRESRKCKTFTDEWTDEQTWSKKVTWPYSSGVQKKKPRPFSYILIHVDINQLAPFVKKTMLNAHACQFKPADRYYLVLKTEMRSELLIEIIQIIKWIYKHTYNLRCSCFGRPVWIVPLHRLAAIFGAGRYPDWFWRRTPRTQPLHSSWSCIHHL